MRRLRWQLPLLALALAATVIAAIPASADAVADGIDAARVKAKAGKHTDALAELDALLPDHAADPRVQYQRALVLKDLKRQGDAADAIEAAQAAMEKYEADGGKDAPVLAIKAGLKTEAASLLKYRIEARKLLADYWAKSLDIARKLLDEKRPLEAAYVLEEVEGACPETAGQDDFTRLVVAVKEALRAEPAPKKEGE